jgi:G3E family GTPase
VSDTPIIWPEQVERLRAELEQAREKLVVEVALSARRYEENKSLRNELEQARTEIQIKDAQIVVISEMYDRVHEERDYLKAWIERLQEEIRIMVCQEDEATQEGERAENPNYVEGRNFDKETRDHLARASDRRRDTIDGESTE